MFLVGHFDSNEKISFAKCKYISLKAHLKNRKKTDLEVGDLVFTRIGAGLGKVCIVEPWMPEFSILHSASMIRVKKERMLSPFLMEFIKSNFLQRQIKVEVQSIGVPDLGLDKIKEFKRLKELRDSYLPGTKISAGTSRDYEIALGEGIDIVRVGNALIESD